MEENDNFALAPRPPSALEKAVPGAKRILTDMVADTLALTRKARRLRVVMVDDEPYLLEVYVETFRAWFSQVDYVPFSKPLKALEELEQRDPDLLITGIKMPNMTGYQLIERLFARKIRYPILVLTLFRPAKEWVEDYARRGFNVHYFGKPGNEQELEQLRSVLGTILQIPLGSTEELIRFAHPPSAPSLTKEDQLQPTKSTFRIGEYEWREPDYRQILIWAKALSLEPEEVIRRLLDGKKGTSLSDWIETTFDDGTLQRLNWDFDLLPLEKFEWVDDLALTHLAFPPSPEMNPALSLRLPSLKYLQCEQLGLTRLDLSGVPLLDWLWCGENRLTALNLSNLPKLAVLWCGDNQLTELDLSRLPILYELSCEDNRLTKLDLSGVPVLSRLWCNRNRFNKLDLSKVPLLTSLWCEGNQLKELGLSDLRTLVELKCDDNQLTNLDLSGLRKLAVVDCATNQLTMLSLSDVPLLAELHCQSNQLTRLSLHDTPMLAELWCYNNQLAKLDLSGVPVLTQLWCSLNQLAKLDLSYVPMVKDLSCEGREGRPIKVLDIRPLQNLEELCYDAGITRLIQRPDQNF